MYLSRIELNTRLRETMKALASPNRLHGALESAFAGERRRRLWRLDSLGGKLYVLMLSGDVPDLSSFAEQFGFEGGYETKDYSKLLDRIENGSKWHFRLTANPTVAKCYKDANGDTKHKNVPLTEKQSIDWLKGRAEALGFSLENDDFQIVGTKLYDFYKRGGSRSIKVRFFSVTFEGVLTVTDSEKFKATLCNGIGREKAYGQGMITIVGG